MSHGRCGQVRTRPARVRASRCPRRPRAERRRDLESTDPQARLQRQGAESYWIRKKERERKKKSSRGRGKQQESRRKRRQKESAGKQSSWGRPASSTWAGMGTELRLRVRSAPGASAEGALGRRGGLGMRGAPGALSGAAYLRRGRPHALPGAARGGRGAERGTCSGSPREERG